MSDSEPRADGPTPPSSDQGGVAQKGALPTKIEALLHVLSARRLLFAASVCTTVALVFMVLPIFVDIPLFLMASLTIAHAAGLGGVLLFGASVLREVLVRDGAKGP